VPKKNLLKSPEVPPERLPPSRSKQHTTSVISSTSKPLAATSVATSVLLEPLVKSSDGAVAVATQKICCVQEKNGKFYMILSKNVKNTNGISVTKLNLGHLMVNQQVSVL
jgi:hypothetical protein